MDKQPGCNCGAVRYNLVFACSGAADVGGVTDRVARTLSHEKTAAMCCTAAIAAEDPAIMEKAAFASTIIVLDGCDKACAKKILAQQGFTDPLYVELGALGMEKGTTPVNDENSARVIAAVKSLMRPMSC